MMLQLGWKAGTEQYPPAELLDYAIAAEEAGFDFLDASDHFHPWSEQGQASFAWSWLGAVAARTRKLVLGTGLTCPILRYHPAVVAQAAATMACLAPQRFYLAVGTGEALNEYAATGQWPSYSVRREQLEEAIELIRALWTGEKVTHHGAYYQTQQAKLYTRPPQDIPLYVSSMVPDSAGFAGRCGDGLLTVGGQELDLYRELLQNFAAGAKEEGKDPKRLPRIMELAVGYTHDIDAAIRHRQTYWAGSLVPALYLERIYTPEQSAQNGKVAGPDTIRRTGCFSADPQDHVAFARRYIDLGFTHIVFHCGGPDQRAFIESFGRDVLPQLRAQASVAQEAVV
jgi:coenzyme F420-dependent glucose-6-phosphate dehydrogenase